MIKSIGYYISQDFCPYHNLVLEELLAENIADGEAILYLWQNADTVVIGKHQNAYLECNYDIMLKENISLARRKTGGGAVFHDKKNLNFTFISNKRHYDVKRNQSIICKAVESFGLQCQATGRNDITYQGKKFSGNAFLIGKDVCIHHGTIMLDVDVGKLERFLNVDKTKLLSKGVASVRSRVINLKSVIPQISVEKMKEALIVAFDNEYGLESSSIALPFAQELIDIKKKEYASKEFLFGKYPTILGRKRKEYGEIIIALLQGKLTLYSDCLDVGLIDFVRNQLHLGKKSIPIEKEFSLARVGIIEDINQMLLEIEN